MIKTYLLNTSFICLLLITIISCNNNAEKDNKLSFFNKTYKEKITVFKMLPVGDIKPKGWLKNQLERDLEYGYVAKYDKITPSEMEEDLYGALRRDYIPDSLTSWRKGTHWWLGEQQGYWWDGLMRSAILVDDSALLEMVENHVRHLMQTQDTDGYLGIYTKNLRYTNFERNGELWTQSKAIWILLNWYSYSHELEVLECIEKAVDNTMRHVNKNTYNPFSKIDVYGGVSHGLMFSEAVAELYSITKNNKYRDYSVWLYQAFSEGKKFDNDIHYSYIQDKNKLLIGHSAHSFEHLRVLMNSWYFTGYEELEKGTENYFKKIDRVILPSGAGFGYENLWGLEAHADSTPVEYCAIVELELSFIHALKLTGNSDFGDKCEKLFYNAAQGARLPDLKAVTYCKPDNCYHLKGESPGMSRNGAGYEKHDDRYKYSPAHLDVAQCCATQATRAYPHFISASWMKTENGIAATLLAPTLVNTTINDVAVSIEEISDYPFRDRIVFIINPRNDVEFELKIRKPAWANKAEIIANNTEIKIVDGYYVLNKTWTKGDSIIYNLNPEVTVAYTNNNEKYLERGSLVFALSLPSIEKTIKDYPLPGFHDSYFSLAKNTFFDYSLPLENNFEVSFSNIKPSIWSESPISIYANFKNNKTNKTEKLKLEPIGTSILRRVSF